MTADQASAMLKWLEVLFLTQLAVGMVLIVALVALVVTRLWYS